MATNSRSSRQQLQDVPSALITNADRNIILTGGGTVGWDLATNTFSWSADFVLRIPRLGAAWTVPAGSAAMSSSGHNIFVVVNRSNLSAAIAIATETGATEATAYRSVVDGSAATTGFDGDNVVVLAVRQGNDIYLRNGLGIEGSSSSTTTTTIVETPPSVLHANAMLYVGVSLTPMSSFNVAVSTAPYGTPAAGLEASGASKIDITNLSAWDDSTGTYPTAQSMPAGTLFNLGTWELKVYRNGILLTPDYAIWPGGATQGGNAAPFVGDYHEVEATAGSGGSSVPGKGKFIQFYPGRQPMLGETLTFSIVQSPVLV